jgi:hypothetical protein
MVLAMNSVIEELIEVYRTCLTISGLRTYFIDRVLLIPMVFVYGGASAVVSNIGLLGLSN